MDRLGLWINPFLRDDVTVYSGCKAMAMVGLGLGQTGQRLRQMTVGIKHLLRGSEPGMDENYIGWSREQWIQNSLGTCHSPLGHEKSELRTAAQSWVTRVGRTGVPGPRTVGPGSAAQLPYESASRSSSLEISHLRSQSPVQGCCFQRGGLRDLKTVPQFASLSSDSVGKKSYPG